MTVKDKKKKKDNDIRKGTKTVIGKKKLCMARARTRTMGMTK